MTINIIRIIASVLCVTCLVTSQNYNARRPIPVFRDKMSGLLLPGNATAIRENIVDTFSCENRIYGYYADIDNECQIFHICMPQERGTLRWSFICPSETVFNQATFVCTRINESIPCEESEQYYALNEEIGKEEKDDENPEVNPEENTNGNSEETPGGYYPADNDFDNELPMTPFPPNNLRGKGKSVRRGKSKVVESNKDNNNNKNSTDSPILENLTTTLRSTLSRQRLKN